MHAVYPDEIRAFSQRTSIPVVGSELLMTRWQYRDWLEKGVSQILMTDTSWTGGIAETRKIAAMAEAYNVPLVLHNIAGPVSHAAAMHLGAHIPNLFMSSRCGHITATSSCKSVTSRCSLKTAHWACRRDRVWASTCVRKC